MIYRKFQLLIEVRAPMVSLNALQGMRTLAAEIHQGKLFC